MPRARLVYLPAEVVENPSSDFVTLQQQSTNLLRRASSNSEGGLSPSYKLGVALGTIGGIALLLIWFIIFWYSRRTWRKNESGSDVGETSIETPRSPIWPPEGGQGLRIGHIQHGGGRPIERLDVGGDRPLEPVPDAPGRPLEPAHLGGGRPIERGHDGPGRPLEHAPDGPGRPLERAEDQLGRPLERPPGGGRGRRVGNRPLERPSSGAGVRPLRGGEAALERRGWTRPSRRRAAIRKKGP